MTQATRGIRGAPPKTTSHGHPNEAVVRIFIESINSIIGKMSATSPQMDIAAMRNRHNREWNLDAVFAKTIAKRHMTVAKNRPTSTKKNPNDIEMPLVMELSLSCQVSETGIDVHWSLLCPNPR
jgi:hypothetical protein